MKTYDIYVVGRHHDNEVGPFVTISAETADVAVKGVARASGLDATTLVAFQVSGPFAKADILRLLQTLNKSIGAEDTEFGMPLVDAIDRSSMIQIVQQWAETL